jgi:type IV secretory pathway component VirB8
MYGRSRHVLAKVNTEGAVCCCYTGTCVVAELVALVSVPCIATVLPEKKKDFVSYAFDASTRS